MNHFDDCYFCIINITGINRNNRNKWTYSNLASAIRPIPHSDEIPIPLFQQLPTISEGEISFSDIPCDKDRESGSDYEGTSSNPQCFNQTELSDLIRDLRLSKESSELLASRLNDKNLLDNDTKITFYRTREKNFLSFFSHESNLVFCQEVRGLMIKMGLPEYFPSDWRLFIYSFIFRFSSKRSLKCVLLHNGNKYGSIPIAHSSKMKEEYKNIALVMDKIKFHEHQWVICVDLKMVSFLLGQQWGSACPSTCWNCSGIHFTTNDSLWILQLFATNFILVVTPPYFPVTARAPSE